MESFSTSKRKVPNIQQKQNRANSDLNNEKIIKVELLPQHFSKSFFEVPIFTYREIFDIGDVLAFDEDNFNTYAFTESGIRKFMLILFFPGLPDWATLNIFPKAIYHVNPGTVLSTMNFFDGAYAQPVFTYQWIKTDNRHYYLYIHFSFSNFGDPPQMFMDLSLVYHNDRIFTKI